jgi:dipeptidyl aminopeptidase/acylaminoacyl peptidase
MILWPRFLPDGRHFIYFAGSSRPEHTGIYVGSLDSDQTKLVMNTDFRAWYALGRLLFLRGEAVLAQPFDVARFQVHGEPMVIADGVWYARPAAQASFSVSETGTLAYVNATLWDGELIWFDRAGRALGSAGPAVRHEGVTPQISRDGRRIAVTRGEFGREDIWLLGAAGESPTRLTFTTESDGMPVWSGDSRRIMFGTTQLFVRDVDAGTEEMVMDSAPGQLLDWSRDGRFVVFQRSGSRAQLWYAQLANGSPLPFLEGPYNMTQAQLSPDGKWIAYTSNESGRDEIYVQAFPVPGRKRQVSNGGGAMPRWRQDGRELFYLAGNQYITAVSILDSVTVTLGPPTPLFRTRLVVEGSESVGLPVRYDVAPDGLRFLIRYPPADPGPPITVVINWLSALNR